jgi:hypothetical protein
VTRPPSLMLHRGELEARFRHEGYVDYYVELDAQVCAQVDCDCGAEDALHWAAGAEQGRRYQDCVPPAGRRDVPRDLALRRLRAEGRVLIRRQLATTST